MTIKEKILVVIKTNLMTLLMLLGVICGVLMAVIMKTARQDPYTQRQIMYVGFPGELFMQMLKLIALPLMIAAIVSALGSLDTVISKRIGLQLVLFITVLKLISVSLGIILTIIFHPGKTGSSDEEMDMKGFVRKNITTVDNFLDIMRNLFPPNIIDMHLRIYETVLIPSENNTDIQDWEVSSTMKHTTNMLGIVNCSVILGIALAKMQADGRILTNLFVCITNAVMIITMWLLWISPVLVMFLVASQLLQIHDLSSLMTKAGLFAVVMIFGYILQAIVMYALLYFVFVRKNPYRYMHGYIDGMLTAFATSSSIATMPISIQCLDKLGIDKRLTRFVIPIAHNISMDGAAYFQGVAAVFIAQLNNFTLSAGNYTSILLLGTAASIASAGIPYSATICLVLVLDGIGLPIKDLGILLAIDSLIDRCSTVINVLGDFIIVGILAHINRNMLEETVNDIEETKTDQEAPDKED